VTDLARVSLPLGHIVDATIRAVIEHTDGIGLQDEQEARTPKS